jgi:beta-glucosidase
VSIQVENTGRYSGDEVVQLYIHDLISSVTTPVKQLKGFQRISLRRGRAREVEFVLTPDDLSLLNREMRRVVETGMFEVMVGRSSDDILARGHFEVKP